MMRPVPAGYCVVVAMAGLACFAAPSGRPAENEQGIEIGKALFRSNCAFCHGLNAGGGRGPSLISATFVQNTTDPQIKAIISNGVPGTSMPAFSMEGDDLQHVVAYIRHLGGADRKPAHVAGDIAAGRAVYERSGCAGCHRIGSSGVAYGPELTRVGAARSPEYTKESIVDPSKDVPPEFEAVTVVTRQGQRATGIRLNEDTFSLQLRLPDESFLLVNKRDIRELTYHQRSVMPSYRSLPHDDLQNLLAYLDSLRGGLAPGAQAVKAKGIH